MSGRRPIVESRKARGLTRQLDRASAAVAAARATAAMVVITEASEDLRPGPAIQMLRLLIGELAKVLVNRIGATNAGLLLANEAARHLPAFRQATEDARAVADKTFSKKAA